MFQNLRQGNSLYVLEKSNKPKLRICEVVSVTNPMPKFLNNYQTNTIMTVDIRVKDGEGELELKQLQADLSLANSGTGLIVSDNRDAMLNEVESTRRMSENALASMEYHRAMIDACEEMMRTLSPSFAKEKEQEDRIDRLEKGMSDIKSMLAEALGRSPMASSV